MPGSVSPGICGLAGHQIDVPGTRRRSTRRARVVLHTPCTSESAMPIADALLDRKQDDGRGGRHDQQEFERTTGGRSQRSARHGRCAARRTAGRRRVPPREHAATASRRIPAAASTTATATRPASCDRPPVSQTIPVRGGLALTGNAPNNPASTLPAPTPMKSRLTSGGSSASDGNDRVVAAVCTITTIAMMRPSGTRRIHWPMATSGSVEFRQADGDHAENRNAAALQSHRDDRRTRRDQSDQRAGNPRIDLFRDRNDREHAEADRQRERIGVAELGINAASRASIGACDGAGNPRMAGNWEIRM